MADPVSRMPSADPMLGVRLVSIDYYLAPPVHGLDVVASSYLGVPINRVPIVRIFGAASNGRKTCLHLHRYRFPSPCSFGTACPIVTSRIVLLERSRTFLSQRSTTGPVSHARSSTSRCGRWSVLQLPSRNFITVYALRRGTDGSRPRASTTLFASLTSQRRRAGRTATPHSKEPKDRWTNNMFSRRRSVSTSAPFTAAKLTFVAAGCQSCAFLRVSICLHLSHAVSGPDIASAAARCHLQERLFIKIFFLDPTDVPKAAGSDVLILLSVQCSMRCPVLT